ncbi:uncharacterized protein FYW49_013669 [Xenentodon cancila]
MHTQLVGFLLAFIGFLGTILICALPMWKVTAFVGANIITAQVFWEGLWMNCVIQSTGHLQCKVYDSILALPQDLQGARALVSVSLAVSVVAIGLTVVGVRCTNFFDYDRLAKTNIGIAGGVVFILAGLLCIIAVSWSAYTIITGFYNPTAIEERKGELGASIYVGWVSGALLIIGGGILCGTYRCHGNMLAEGAEKTECRVRGSCLTGFFKQFQRSSLCLDIMASMGMQMLASALCLMGWAGVIICCILPFWKVTAFVGSTIVTSQTMWEGIWMTCVAQSTGHIQCKPYDSLLALTSDLQAARALTVLAIATGSVGLILAFLGGKCTRFLDEDGYGVKGKVSVAAGLVFIATGLLCLIPTSWTAGAVVRDFYSVTIDAQRMELGASLYIGWGASILLVLGGGLFVSSAWPHKNQNANKSTSVRYLVARSSNGYSQVGSTVPPAMSVRAMTPRPQSQNGVTTKQQQQYARPPWGQDRSQESERSWVPSTKSQMNRPGSTQSDLSEVPSTKSQLKRADMDKTLSAKSENEHASVYPAKTYL